MSNARSQALGKSKLKKFLAFLSGTAAVALVGGSLVVAGVSAQKANAAPPPPPGVSVATPSSYIWGEDLPITVTFTGSQSAGPQYNLSAGILLPADVTVVSHGLLGAPVATYTSDDGALPGVIVEGSDNGDSALICADLGLEQHPTETSSCAVPDGMQYLVYQNISDLPVGAVAEHTITVRPNAANYGIGTDLNYQVNAYTSNAPRYIPVFPGSTGVGHDAEVGSDDPAQLATSNPGRTTGIAEVNALRISKAEVSHPENEVLRGVHGENGAVFELTIDHTGQADLSDAQVVDYLPAGLEYLGSCGIDDNTSTANGTPGSEEYTGAGELNTEAVDDHCLEETSVETVAGSFNEAGVFIEDEDGEVYTRVTWNLADNRWKVVNSENSTANGVAQPTDLSEAGNPATTVIRYRAGVPLFENTLDFGGTMPDAGSRQQGANLDNNRGASTRHGTHLTDVSQPGAHRGPDGRDDNAGAIPYTNVAIASGSYDDEPVSDRDSETITAVDVRIVKTMNDGEPGAVGSFEQGNLVKYTLSLATSEYVAATIPNPDERPLRIVDDMANGLCPVFPQGTNIWGDEGPEFFLGAYNAETETAPTHVTAAEWNDALVSAGVDNECAWNINTGASNGADGETRELSDDGALISIAFSPTEGRFFLEFALNDEDSLNAANSNVAIEYFVHQNSAYIQGTEGGANDHGATTSRDLFSNESEINLRTTPIVAVTEPSVFPPGIDNDERERLNADWNAWDDSRAFAQAGETVLTKHVLERGVVPEAAHVWREHNTAQASSSANGPDPARWVDSATQPFAVGDETWYRIVIDPPDGADVRNPVFTDFLPEGVSFDATIDPDTDRPENLVIVPTGWQERFPTFGTCTSFTGSEEEQLTKWRDIYAPMAYDTGAETEPLITLDENVLTFKLGARGDDCGVGSTDRFLPFDASLEIYLKVTVTNPSAFAKVDLPQNLAKYQQSNMEEEIFFLRDDAAIESDRVAKLVKGVETVTDNDDEANSQREARSQNAEGSVGQDGKNFNSNRDGIEVVQGEEVTYRLDVTAPYNDTTGYLIWDVLPEGIKAADVNLSSAKGYLVTDGTPGDTALDGVTVDVYDVSPSEITLKPGFENRSVIVWNVTDTIPASTKAIPAVLDTNGDEIEPAIEAVERGLTLKYTVTVPKGVQDGGNAAQITQEYDNIASIVEFGTMNNGGGTTKMVVNGPSSVATDRTAGTNEYEYQDTAGELTDDSGIYLPDVVVEKTLFSSQVGANGVLTDDRASNNAQNQIVQGELVTFNYEVTIPANTTVKNARLFDRDTWSQFTAATGGTSVGSPVEYKFMSADYFYNETSFLAECGVQGGSTFADFACENNYSNDGVVGHGAVVFPESYTNSSGSEETFGVQITVWIENDLNHARWLENVAQFDFDDPNNTGQRITETARERVQYIEPQPNIAKQAVSADGENLREESPIVKPASAVTYELVVTNANNRPALFNGVVYDCVPAELTNIQNFSTTNASLVSGVSCDVNPAGEIVLDSETGVPANDAGYSGQLIKWELDSEVRPGTPLTLTYTATVDPEAGGSQVMRNAAHLRGYTIPSGIDNESTPPSDRRDDREARTNEDISLTSASVTKTVGTPQAPIGDTVEYTITATFPANANYYDVALVDTLPTGVEYVDTTSTVVDWKGAANEPTVENLPTIAGSVLTWQLEGGDDFSGSPGIDFRTHDEDRTITITYTARITDDVTQDNLVNEVELTWNAVNDTPSSEGSNDDTATVTVVHPAPTIDKKVQGEDQLFKGNPDAELDYTIKVGNTAGRPDAHDVSVIDTVPSGVFVDELTISAGGVLAGQNPETGGGTITWTNLGPIVGGESITLSYTATFVEADDLDTTVKTNTVKVDRYYSWNDDDPVKRREYTNGPNGPNDTAQVQPIVPAVELDKAVTSGDIAYAGKPFGWTITATNTGEGDAQELSISDTLPVNWNFDTDTLRAPKISADGGNTWQSLESPSQSGSLASGITLSWSSAQIREALDLTGETDPVLAGAAGAPYQTVQIRFSSVPTISARDDAAGHTAVDTEGTRVPVPHINTVTAIAEDTRGDEGLGDDPTEHRYSQDEPTANAYIHAADLTITKEQGSDDPIKAGTTREGAWKITVTNTGPDTATGPITVSDTTAALPAGVRITDISGEGWTCAHPSRTDQGVTTFTCDRTEPDDSLDAGASFEPIYVDVAVSSNQPAVTGLSNTVEVHPGNTFDPNEENNTDTSSIETTTEADLQIVKTFTPAGEVHNAGDTISWNLVVKNNGPSDSVSSADNPITVTDEVPSHITDVAQLAGWSVPAGWNLAIDGNNITLTMDDGLSLVDQGEVTFSFQGVVDPATPQGTVITNTGKVTPGETPDPDEDNNEDPDSTHPTVKETTVQAAKERVVADGAGGWDTVPAGTNVIAGEPVHYRLAITNTGQAEATNLTMIDTLPAYLSVDDPVVFDGTGWSPGIPGEGDAVVFNNPGPLAPGATSSLVLTVHVDDSHTGALVNAVCVEADEAVEESCVTDSTGTDKRVDWEIAKTREAPIEGTTFNAGETVTYELTVTNNGPSESAGPITVTDTLPLGFTFVEGSSEVTGAAGHSVNTETYVAGKQVIEWTLEGPFPAESHITLAYDVLISATADPGAYTNTARVTGVQCSADDAEAGNCLPEPGENPETPNQDTDTITVLRSTSMNIEKEVQSLDATWGESATHVAGTEVTWRVKITNNGPSAAPVTFTEDLTFAPGVSLIAGGTALSGAGWSCNDAEHSCAYTANDGLLPVTLPDESNAAWITVKTTIAPSVEPTVAGEELVNWGRIVWQDKDSNGTETDKNDSDDAEINVVRSADLGITKRALTTDGGGVTDEVVAGESLWYSILLTNHGDSTAVGPYIVTDTLPEGITFDRLLDGLDVGDWIVQQDGQEITFIRGTDAENPDESPLAVGAQLEIRFAANVANDVADEAELTNEVVIDERTLTPNNDPITGPEAPDAAEATVVVQRSVDVSIVKGHLDTESELGGYEVGNTITYTFDVVNDGPSVASGVTVTDTLPIGLSYVENSVDGTDWEIVSAETNSDDREVVTAQYTGTLDEGEAAPQLSFGVKVTAAIGDATTATNEVCVVTAESNTATSDDRCDTDEVPIVPIADLEIKKSVVDPGSVTAGQAISWQLEVQNLGPSDSLNGTTRIRISDEVPAGVHSVTDPSVTNWTASVTRDGEPVDFPARAGDVITWTLDESIERITPTDPTDAPFVSITVNGVLDAGWTSGAVTNRAWVFEGDTRDPEPQNNDSTETVTPGDSTQVTVGKSRVVQVDGEWVIAAEQDPVPNFVPGNDITYLITAINHGPADARAVTIVDEVPAGLTYKDHESVGDGVWEHTSGGVTSAHHGGAPEGRTFSTFTLEDTQQVGAEHKRQFLVTYSTDSALQHSAADPLINWVEINAENDYDFDEDTQRDDDNAHSTRSADLGIVKTHTAPAADTSAVAGETVDYRLVVTNHGPSVSDDPITVSDRLPAEMSYVVGSARIAVDGADPVDAAPAVDGTELTWLDVTGEADLPVGAEVIITFTALIDTDASVRDPLVNFASVDGPNDNNPDNNTSRDDVELKGVADLDIRKSVANDPGTVTAGEGIDWLIEVRNLGPSSSMSVTAPITITDVVPEGVLSVADPSTTDWAATVTREGLASSFPARAGDVITWQFTGDRILANPNATADAAYTLALSGTVDAAWTQGEITNTVTIVPGDTEDPESQNNEAKATEIPGDTTQVNVGKSRVVQVDGEWVVAAEQEPVPNFVPGADISYRITVITDGPADAREVTVVDEVPAGLTYKAHVSLDTGVWAYSTGGTTSKYRDVAPEGRTFATFALEGTQQVGVDNKREFVVTYSTDPAIQHSAGDPLINEVEVDAVNDRDFNEIPQRDRDNAHSTRSADLGIVKTHTAPEAGEAAVAGETVDYRLLVTNHGPSDSDEPIHIVDILPAGFSYVTDSALVSVNGAEAIAVEPAVEGNELVWTDVTDGVDLVFEGTVEITFTVAIEADHDPATGIVNTAAVDGPNDNNPDNNTSNDPIDITGVANLTIGKEAITPVEEISAGEAVSWLITPRNEGPSTSLSTADAPITVTDTLPEGISRLLSDPSTSDWQATTSNAGGWEAATAGDTITFTYLGERFVVGQEPDITVTALIDPSWIGGEAITNTATIAPGDTPDPELSNDGTSIIVPGDRTVLDIAKNRVVQVDGEWVLAGTLEPVPTVTPGETVSYRIDVVNNGPAIARNVTVVDSVPEGLSDPQITLLDGYGEWTGETATCEDGVTELAGYASDECLTATLADSLGIGVANARSFIVTFATDPALDIEAELVNWAQARADNVPEDERPEDDDSTENRAIADLSIAKSVAQERVLAGGTVDYELLVTNEGPSVARGPITITDTLPAGMSYVAESATVSVAGADAVATEPTISESETGDTLTWIVFAEGEQLATGETIVVQLQTVTNADRIAPDGLVNTATVSADDDTNPLNNEDTAIVVVDPVVTLVVEKTAVGEFKVGETGRYLITVTNVGPTADPGPITVTDSLPEGLSFVSSDDDTADVDGNTVTWIIENGLQVGETHEIELVVSIGKAAFSTVENTVVIDSPAEKTPESVLEDDEVTRVLAADELPSTGRNVALGFLIAGMLVLAGTGVLVLRDRRRSEGKAEV